MSRRKEIVDAVVAQIATNVPNAAVRVDEDLPERVEPGGWINIVDEDPADPEVTLSPPRYNYDHPLQIECVVQGGNVASRRLALDNLLSAVAVALRLDTTFSGNVTDSRHTAAVKDVSAPTGAAEIAGGVITLTLMYTLNDPLE